MSIRTRLLLYTVPLIVLPILLLGFFAYRFLMKGFDEQVRLEGEELCQMTADRIEQKLDECYANMLVLQSEAAKEWGGASRFEAMLSDGSALTARLAQRFAIRHSPFVQIRIVRADGEVLLVARGLHFDRSHQNALDDPVFLQAVSVGFNKRSPSQFPPTLENGTRRTTFAAPIFSLAGIDSLLGLLLFDLDVRFVDRILNEMNTLQSGDYILADGGGNVVAQNAGEASSRENMLRINMLRINMLRINMLRRVVALSSLSESPDDPHAADGLHGDVSVTTKPVKEYIAFREPVPEERWYVAVANSSSPLHAAFRRTLLLFFSILVVALVSGVTGTLFIARKITQPIGNLTHAVQRFAQGELESKIPVQSKDEIGMLTADFNKMADDLRQLMRERQTNETLLAIGRLSSSLVHDLRNPIEGLKLLSTELLKRIELGRDELVRKVDDSTRRDSLGEVADTIHQSVGRLSSLLMQSLNFARLTHPEFSPTNIVVLADEAINDIRVGSTALRKKYDWDIPLIEMDAVQIKRVLSNILLNAVEACRNNPAESPGVVELLLRAEKTKIRIEIADNGSGIPSGQMEKIFEPFFSTKPEGHGLGLSFARQILKNHGGELLVMSEVGKGTLFIAVIPVAQKQSGEKGNHG